jgi:hypothetical protein
MDIRPSDLKYCCWSSIWLMIALGLIAAGVILFTGNLPLPADQLNAYGCHIPAAHSLPQQAASRWIVHSRMGRRMDVVQGESDGLPAVLEQCLSKPGFEPPFETLEQFDHAVMWGLLLHKPAVASVGLPFMPARLIGSVIVSVPGGPAGL